MTWFASWFDSPYYHILYRHRDDSDAGVFISSLLDHLNLSKGSTIIDLGCGKGRHARIIAQQGYHVIGLDLSPESINHCNSLQIPNAEFHVHDMRNPFPASEVDAVFNLFTSFGYFDTDQEHQEVISNAAGALKTGGILVIDYLNSFQVESNLIAREQLLIDQIEFNIQRFKSSGRFIKQIEFSDRGANFRFEEKVAALCLDDFKRYLSNAGFQLEGVYGNYELHPFDEKVSSRLIIIARKK